MNDMTDVPHETNFVGTAGRRTVSRKQVAASCAGVIRFLGASAYGYDWWTVGRFIEKTDDAYVGGDVTVVAPKVAGFIAQVGVTDNQSVHAGDLLVKLDDRDYRAAVARGEAAVAGQLATLANPEATRRLQQSQIAQARAGIDTAEAEIARARDDEARFRQLSGHSAASIQIYQKAQADYKKALAAGDAAKAALESAQRQLDVIGTRKLQASAVSLPPPSLPAASA